MPKIRTKKIYMIVDGAISRAKKKNLPCDSRKALIAEVTRQMLKSRFRCPYTLMPYERNAMNGGSDYSASIDKIRPELGYVVSNIRVCSFTVNRVKNNKGYTFLKMLVTRMEELGETDT